MFIGVFRMIKMMISAKINFGLFGVALLADGKGRCGALSAPGCHLFGSLSGCGLCIGVVAIRIGYLLAICQRCKIGSCCRDLQLIIA